MQPMMCLLVWALCFWAVSCTPSALYNDWLAQHGPPPLPHDQAFDNFIATLGRLQTSNKSGQLTASDLNSLATMSADEFAARNNLVPVTSSQLQDHGATAAWSEASPELPAAPSSFDWRDQGGMITPVKNQQKCGGCWAFAAVECVETASALAGNPLVQLSAQELISCDTFDEGCTGGNTINTRQFLQQHGLQSETTYPFTSSAGGAAAPCAGTSAPSVDVQSLHWMSPTVAEADWTRYLYKYGPLAVAVYAATDPWQDYTGGVMSRTKCNVHKDDGVNHAVVLVGWGNDTDAGDYWVVRNSWGVRWGIGGYALIPRSIGCFGITTEAPTYFTVLESNHSVKPLADNCADYSSCLECVDRPECGFCTRDNLCIPGDSAGPTLTQCASGWLSDTCPSCPASGHNKWLDIEVLIAISACACVLGVLIGVLIIGFCPCFRPAPKIVRVHGAPRSGDGSTSPRHRPAGDPARESSREPFIPVQSDQ